ncbi:hypothetical protein ACFV9C_44445 [Kribbella sp. NPDC059898]|uniref:hypothetical protein n=1 Tax=Kribbella sp. NPDC059898 TaxID=3346995 RepID=UPI003660EE38
MTALTVASSRARADVEVVLAFAGSTQLSQHADVRVVGRQLRAKAHRALARERGQRRTIEREAAPGAYAALPAWMHRDQWLALVEAAAVTWFPEQIHRRVRVATLLKFAALVAAHADDATGRSCWRPYPDLARGMAVTVETVRKCWRALERLGLAVQVEPSVCFTYDQRLQLWRKGSKQRGLTPEYALVVPAAFARAIETGEHPADLLALEHVDDAGEPAGPADRLSAALRALRTATPAPVAPEPVPTSTAAPQPAPVAPQMVASEPAAATQTSRPQEAVDNHRQRPTTRLQNVDILGLPRSGTRPSYTSMLALVTLVPHGVKSTASRAHNRGGRTDSVRPGGTPARGTTHKRHAGRGSWFGPHRDIAVYLTGRVLWLRGVRPGRIAMQLRRFTVPGLPLVWRPADFVAAFDAVNRRQGRYSPGANLAGSSTADQGHAASAAAGAVTSPPGLLKWYLEQIDPVNDHPRVVLEFQNERIAASVAVRRTESARERAAASPLGTSSARGSWQAARQALTVSVHGGQA